MRLLGQRPRDQEGPLSSRYMSGRLPRKRNRSPSSRQTRQKGGRTYASEGRSGPYVVPRHDICPDPRGPVPWGSPRWGRGCQRTEASPDRSAEAALISLSEGRDLLRGTSGGTPDRSKLFGSHGQRPWFHEVMSVFRGRGPVGRAGTCL